MTLKQTKTEGFTLLEILVAISLATLLFGLLLALYSLANRTLANSSVRAELAQNGRLMTERLGREILQSK